MKTYRSPSNLLQKGMQNDLLLYQFQIVFHDHVNECIVECFEVLFGYDSFNFLTPFGKKNSILFSNNY